VVFFRLAGDNMRFQQVNITKTLVLHYYPAWIAWSGIYCIVFSSLDWQPPIGFIRLFAEIQFQVVFVYLFIIGSLNLFKPTVTHDRLLTVFAAMIGAVICWETGSFLFFKQLPQLTNSYRFSVGFLLLRIVSGSFIVWCFMLAERYCLSELMLREQKIQGLFQEKNLTENEIMYLKARIDPELLFEKLQMILALRDTDPDRAKSEQLDLVRFLRNALAITRNERSANETAQSESITNQR
jgi:hypothetical protein